MEFIKTKLDGAFLIKPQVSRDERGFFLESYSQNKFVQAGIKADFVQDNHSLSVQKGVLRGFHFQKGEFAQAKLVRVVQGAVYDVIIDLRRDSNTFGQWQGFDLSAKNFLMLFVPRGFAHAFCTTEDNTEFVYKVDNIYTPEAEDGIIWNDKDLKINWPTDKPILSEKDREWGSFKDLKII